MTRGSRVELIKELEAERGSRILAYVTSDRPPTGAQIGEDALRPIFDLLNEVGRTARLDLLIYSRGGALEVPWRIASALRNTAKEWHILVPFRANSAATLLALGADSIVLGAHGELGPIDPIMSLQKAGPNPGTPIQDTINVEDVMAYLRFVREAAGLTDQGTLATSLKSLTDRLDAVVLGSVYRTRTHIRDVARRMLTSQKKPPSERVQETIIETLAERVYAHGHAIGFGEAKDIGLNVIRPNEKIGELMWSLFESYEDELKIRSPLDPVVAVAQTDRYTEDVVLAMAETTQSLYQFGAELEVRAQRQVPPTLNIALNMALQLPVGVDVAQLPQGLQQAMQAAQQQVAALGEQAVKDALNKQAPVVGVQVAIRSGEWRRAA